MNKLNIYYKNPFLSIITARPRFGMFVYDHLNRMKSAKNPSFDQTILSTETLYDVMFTTIENRSINFNDRVSYTRQVNKMIRDFGGRVLKMESHVSVEFTKGSKVYYEFYPHGRTEYHRVNKSNVMMIFDRIIGLTTKYEAELGSAWKDEFIAMYALFMPVFKGQLQTKGKVAGSKSDFDQLRFTMCNQLYKNLLVILAEYYESPEKSSDFFNETIVNWKKHPKKIKTENNFQLPTPTS